MMKALLKCYDLSKPEFDRFIQESKRQKDNTSGEFKDDKARKDWENTKAAVFVTYPCFKDMYTILGKVGLMDQGRVSVKNLSKAVGGVTNVFRKKPKPNPGETS